uniref:Homeobox domain-containing protein n=1 Tax=Peronospora matthiolae TaxID=2874970 RepID=A0AAV1U9M6_9STRA
MTLPNRPGYVPGQQRRVYSDTKVAVTMIPGALPRRVQGEKPMDGSDPEPMQRELKEMLKSLAPGHEGAMAMQSIPTSEESLAYVGHCRTQLLDDQVFQESGSFQGLLMLANNSVLDVGSIAGDPFDAVIEQMPPSPSPLPVLGASSDGYDAGGDPSRVQYMEADWSLQTMARAASEVVKDPTVGARYEHAAHQLHEWGERRMVQQQQLQSPPSSASAATGGSSLPMSLAGISPYAMELAARNNLPKKRSSLSKVSKKLMHDWFEHNLHHPYPTEEEKDWLARRGGITLEQVNNWFINTRGRKWKPMLNRLMAEKQAGACKLYDQMVEKIEEPYHKF